jgi:hypothetical protein
MLFGGTDVHPYGSFWLDVADKVVKTVALGVGAWWAVMNFKKSRTYTPRLEPSVSGEVFSKDGQTYLLIKCQIKNVGQSVYKIIETGTGCEVITLSKGGRNRISVLRPFRKKHGWIEPGEQISDPFVLRIPDPKTFIALQLDLRIISDGIEWNGSSIIKSPDVLDASLLCDGQNISDA